MIKKILLCACLGFVLLGGFLLASPQTAKADEVYTIENGIYQFNDTLDFSMISNDIHLTNLNIVTQPYYWLTLDEYDVPDMIDTIDDIYLWSSGMAVKNTSASYSDIYSGGWNIKVDINNGTSYYAPTNSYIFIVNSSFTCGVNFYNFWITNTNGNQLITNEELQNAYNQGYNQGLQAGQEMTNDESYQAGLQAGQELGYNQGLTTGYQQGYNAGVDTNSYSFYNLISAVIDAPVRALSQFLNFDFLGINVWTFLSAIVGIALIIFIIKLFIGGKNG